MTETGWSDLLVAVEALSHRMVRLAGDSAASEDVTAALAGQLSVRIAKAANQPNPDVEAILRAARDAIAGLAASAREHGRHARELAHAIEVVERIRPDASAETDVIRLSDIAGDEE